MNPSRLTLLTAFGLTLLPAALASGEDYDQSGLTWSATVFPQEHHSGGGAFTREPLTAAMAAPNTTPPLPINVGGDKEGRYHEADFAVSGAFVLMRAIPENSFADGLMDGYVAVGRPDDWGTRSCGYLLRAQPTGNGMNAYLAGFYSHYDGTTAAVSISRIRDDITQPGDVFAESDPFPTDIGAENYRLAFKAEGTALSLQLWRVHVVDGQIVETPVDLDADEPGVQNTLVGSDDELVAGRAGLMAFARGLNSVFFEDVRVILGDCGRAVDFELEYIGTSYGVYDGHVPGDVICTQDGIDVSIEEFEVLGGGQTFNACNIDLANRGFGFNNIMQCSNTDVAFDLSDIGCVEQVKLEFLDLAQFENLQVNDATIYIGDIGSAPANIAPDVTLSIDSTSVSGGKRGVITLDGPVESLRIGGQHLCVDSLCVYVDECIGDLNGDCRIDQADLGILLAAYGVNDGGDLNDDGETNQADLGILLAEYGKSCP